MILYSNYGLILLSTAFSTITTCLSVFVNLLQLAKSVTKYGY
jgi:hypothetical protein